MDSYFNKKIFWVGIILISLRFITLLLFIGSRGLASVIFIPFDPILYALGSALNSLLPIFSISIFPIFILGTAINLLFLYWFSWSAKNWHRTLSKIIFIILILFIIIPPFFTNPIMQAGNFLDDKISLAKAVIKDTIKYNTDPSYREEILRMKNMVPSTAPTNSTPQQSNYEQPPESETTNPIPQAAH